MTCGCRPGALVPQLSFAEAGPGRSEPHRPSHPRPCRCAEPHREPIHRSDKNALPEHFHSRPKAGPHEIRRQLAGHVPARLALGQFVCPRTPDRHRAHITRLDILGRRCAKAMSWQIPESSCPQPPRWFGGRGLRYSRSHIGVRDLPDKVDRGNDSAKDPGKQPARIGYALAPPRKHHPVVRV
jgi:hypothetical protein